MIRWFLFLTLTLELALAFVTSDTTDLYRSPSSRSLDCEMNPNTCVCGRHLQTGCEYNTNTCNCFWIYARDAQSKTAPPDPTNMNSFARLQSETCVIDFSTCLCSNQTVTLPDINIDLPPTALRSACLVRSSTCECGWDNGVHGYAYQLFSKNSPTIPSYQTCITDYATCTCLAGVIVEPPPETTTQPPNQADTIYSMITSLKDTLVAILATAPVTLKALSSEQRQKVISEPVAAMIQLKDLLGDDARLGRLNGTENDALVALLRGEMGYLTQMNEDHEFLAAQLVAAEKPIVQRLRAVTTALRGNV